MSKFNYILTASIGFFICLANVSAKDVNGAVDGAQPVVTIPETSSVPGKCHKDEHKIIDVYGNEYCVYDGNFNNN